MFCLNKQEVLNFLTQKGINFEVTEHPAVFNMEELAKINLPYPECDAKNLLVRDDKKQHYYLITVKGEKRVDLKAFRRAQQTRPLSFATAKELWQQLKLTPGSVTPFGLLNQSEKNVAFYLDSDFLTGLGKIGVHPNDNTATVWLQAADLLTLLNAEGCKTAVVPLETRP